jgi:hypothetical protein
VNGVVRRREVEGGAASWRRGSKLFCEMWPIIETNITEREHRIDFTARLLKLFAEDDTDTYDVEDLHLDVRAAMRRAGIEIAEPDRPQD